jgi:hypothetical protein
MKDRTASQNGRYTGVDAFLDRQRLFVPATERNIEADLQNGGGLEHLCHEGGDAAQLAVAGADARKDAVPHGDARLVARHEAADLRQQHHDAHLQQPWIDRM